MMKHLAIHNCITSLIVFCCVIQTIRHSFIIRRSASIISTSACATFVQPTPSVARESSRQFDQMSQRRNHNHNHNHNRRRIIPDDDDSEIEIEMDMPIPLRSPPRKRTRKSKAHKGRDLHEKSFPKGQMRIQEPLNQSFYDPGNGKLCCQCCRTHS